MNALALYQPTKIVPDRTERALIEVFDQLGRNTKIVYRETMEDFCRFLGAYSVPDAARALFTLEHREAIRLALRYRTDLMNRTPALSARTIQTRLGALAGVAKRLNQIGEINWRLNFPRMNVPRSDTIGPEKETINAMSEAARKQTYSDALAARDAAIVELLYNPALRRSEVANLDLEDVDWDNTRLNVLRKGVEGKAWKTIGSKALTALAEWVYLRGNAPGPLFIRLDPACEPGKIERISHQSVYNVVKRVGLAVNCDTHPHALRHSGATQLARLNNGNVIELAEFLGHKSYAMAKTYVDNTRDLSGEASRKLDADR